MSLELVAVSDRGEWNRFMAVQPHASLYQSFEWGQIRRAQGWEPYYLAVADAGQWVGAGLILARRLPGGLGALLYSPHGPILARRSTQVLAAMGEGVREIAQRARAIFWRIEPRVLQHNGVDTGPFEQAGFHRVRQEWSYWNRPKYDMHLSLTSGETDLFKALGEKGRWNVRSALKRVVIDTGLSDEQLEVFYSLLKHTARKKRILIRSLDYFRRCRDLLGAAGMVQMFVARQGGRPVAAGISTRFGSKAMLFHLSNDYSVPKVGWAVQWEMIRWAVAGGCQVYDFAGTGTNFPPRPTDKGYGVYQFKRSFGAQIVPWYGYADYVFSPGRYAGFRTVESMLPYGEWMLLDWPKSLLHKLGSCRNNLASKSLRLWAQVR